MSYAPPQLFSEVLTGKPGCDKHYRHVCRWHCYYYWLFFFFLESEHTCIEQPALYQALCKHWGCRDKWHRLGLQGFTFLGLNNLTSSRCIAVCSLHAHLLPGCPHIHKWRPRGSTRKCSGGVCVGKEIESHWLARLGWPPRTMKSTFPTPISFFHILFPIRLL